MKNNNVSCEKYIQNLISINNYYYTNISNISDYPYMFAPKREDIINYLICNDNITEFKPTKEIIIKKPIDIYNIISEYVNNHKYDYSKYYKNFRKPNYSIKYLIVEK